MTEAFYLPNGDGVVATPLTRGPWDNRFQHGGPPAALLAGALARWGDDAERWFLARVSFELLRPVPIDALTVTITPSRLGRTVQRLSATLRCGDTPVLTASGTRIRRAPLTDVADPPITPWPAPDACPGFDFPFFQHDVAYHTAIEMRLAHGQWGRTPVGFWTRPRVPLLAGRATLPVERVVIIADAQSGMGVPLPPSRYTFINPDMTLYLEREPAGEWLGFDIRSTANRHGSGLAQSAIRDAAGLIGRSAQSLVVTPRAPHV